MVIGLRFQKGRVQMMTGEYDGNGVGAGKRIALPFTPKHVQVYETGTPVRVWNKNDQMAAAKSYRWTDVPAFAVANEVSFSGNSFTVTGGANTNGLEYYWTAWG